MIAEVKKSFSDYRKRYGDTTTQAALHQITGTGLGSIQDVKSIAGQSSISKMTDEQVSQMVATYRERKREQERIALQLIGTEVKPSTDATTTPSARDLLQNTSQKPIVHEELPPKPQKQPVVAIIDTLFPADLEAPTDDNLAEKQLVWDCIGLLMGARRGLYIQLLENDPVVKDGLPSVQLRTFSKLPLYLQALTVRVCGDLPQKRKNTLHAITVLLTSKNQIDQRLAVVLRHMLADLSAQVEPLKQCIGLQELDCRLPTTRAALDVLNEFVLKALGQGTLKTVCTFAGNAILRPLIDEVLGFYITRFLGPWLHAGVYSSELVCIQQQEQHSLQSKFVYKQGLLELLDPVGTELLTIGRNVHFFSSQQNKDVQPRQTFLTREFFQAQTPEKAAQVLRQKLKPDQPQTFYAFIQALSRESQALVLRLIGPANLQRFLRKASQYILLQRADFATSFLQQAKREMAEPVGAVSTARITNQFEYALQTTECAKDVQLKISETQFMQLYEMVRDGKKTPTIPGIDRHTVKTINLIAVTVPFPPLIELLFEPATRQKLELLNRRLLRQKAVEVDLLFCQQALQSAKTISSPSMKVICRVISNMTGFLRAAELQTQMTIITALDQLQQKIFESESVDQVKEAIDATISHLVDSLVGSIEKLQLTDKCFAEIKVFSSFIEKKFLDVFSNLPVNVPEKERREIITIRIDEIIANELRLLKTLDDQFVSKTIAWRAMHQ